MTCCRLITFVLAILSLLPIPVLGQSAATAQNSPPPLGKLVDVGGYRVHVYCTGTGDPAVIVVGAGFSFNWGLVQPEVAKFTQVCSYDHSGIGWSDDGPADSCSLRVNEVHTALKNLGIKGPYVLVGHSLGGLVARVYAGQYPDEVAGMVFVDHAGSPTLLSLGNKPLPPPPPMPSAPSGGGKLPTGGIESDSNFSKLSARDRELHLWGISQPRIQKALQENHEMMPGCVEEADAILKEHDHPLGNKPLIDLSIDKNRNLAYVELQSRLLSLSQNSKEMVAENSSHLVIIDRPDIVIDAIRQVVQSARDKTKL
ncbi:MAG TPA: alpha/beta hydrolase [Candidatus Polarisedimenticolia bacterium]|nr:alpha/beta hydrolase [Candidatus Polarisedimenticolia bacterium]